MNIPWIHRDSHDPDGPPPVDFPQRRWCFSSVWLDDGLPRALGRPDLRGEVENVHYLPDRQLQVVHRLRPANRASDDDGADDPTAETDLRVTLNYAAGDADAGDAVIPATAGAPGGRWLAQARAQAWIWPDDPAGLPLTHWLSAEAMRAELPPALTRSLQAQDRLQARVLSYAPGERLALRWRVAHEPLAPVAPVALVDAPDRRAADRAGWVMKAQRQGVADTRALHRLWQSPTRRWQMAEPLDGGALGGAEGGAAVLRWERFLPGERLEAAAAREGWARVLQQAASALVALHGHALDTQDARDGLESLQRQDAARVHAQLDRKVMRRIRASLPGLSGRAQALVDRLGRQIAGLGPRPAVLLHGDLHTGNLLRRPDGQIAFIDLDSLMVGDPAWDLALLSTRLMLVGLLDPTQAADLAAPLAAWPQTYIETGGDPGLLPAYRWHVAALLLSRQVKTCVRHHAPDLTRLCAALLAQAEAVEAGAA